MQEPPHAPSAPALLEAPAEPIESGDAGPPEQERVPLAPEFLYGLAFEHLRSLTTLSVSATGGGLLAVQGGILPSGPVMSIPVVMFALAAVLSFLTQRVLVRDLSVIGEASRMVGYMSELAAALFGAGVGAAVVLLLV